MQSEQSGSRSFFLLASLFILAYFALFSYDSLNTYLSFVDGMNLTTMHHVWEVPFRRNLIEILKVFTKENRPLGALFYRPMYAAFGFNSFAFRVAVYILLIVNIIIAHRFARRFGATKGAAALSTLLFCYNASLSDLYYNTGTVYDLLCFPLFFLALLFYVRDRSKGRLSNGTMIAVMLLFLASLDAKENAVMLSADLLFFELLYRREDWKSRATLQRVVAFLAAIGIVCAIYLKVKVTDMATNDLYHPHTDPAFVLKGMGHYFEQYFYLKPDSLGVGAAAAVILVLLGASVALRNRAAIFGILFYLAGVFPVAIIPPRGGYAAYLAFPGLTLVIGAILDQLRTTIIRVTRQQRWERPSMVVLFLGVAAFSVSRYQHDRKVGMQNVLWSQQRVIGFVEAFKRQIPEFPPEARILVLDDPWGPDWGPMFLIRLRYNAGDIWVDRSHNPEKTGGRDSYDLLVTYKDPNIEFYDDKILGFKLKWEARARSSVDAYLLFSAPTEARAPRNLDFSPVAVRTGMPLKITIPGVASTRIDAVYRVISRDKTITKVAKEFCDVDDKGTCTVMAPRVTNMGALAIDWIRRGPNERWIFTNGVVTVVQ
jgi:hypothetical protein